MTSARTSEAGLALIRRSEGLRLERYVDSAGHPTIGYGHLIGPTDDLGEAIDQPMADALLAHDVAIAESAVRSLVTWGPLTQGQFDALVDFVFNLGAAALLTSTLRRKLNAGDLLGARGEFPRWCHERDPDSGAMVESPGLLTRRQAEIALWDAT